MSLQPLVNRLPCNFLGFAENIVIISYCQVIPEHDLLTRSRDNRQKNYCKRLKLITTIQMQVNQV